MRQEKLKRIVLEIFREDGLEYDEIKNITYNDAANGIYPVIYIEYTSSKKSAEKNKEADEWNKKLMQRIICPYLYMEPDSIHYTSIGKNRLLQYLLERI